MDYKRGTARFGALVFVAIFTSVLPGLSTVYAQTNIGTEIVNLATAKCLDVASGSLNSGVDVNQFGCHGGPNQKWLAHNASTPGYVYFENQNSHLCLDVRIGGPKNGTLQQYTCHYRDNQLFRLERLVGGFNGARIVAKHSAYCLEVPSSVAQDRVLIQQAQCQSTRNQSWIYAGSAPYSFPVSANPMGRYRLTLIPGSTYSFSLGGLPAGVAPFMHLWSQVAGNVTPVGQNGPGARVPVLNYVVPFGKGGDHTLFVHAPPGVSPSRSILTIRQNGQLLNEDRGFPIGGTMIDVPDSTGPFQFRYETAEVPGGVEDTFILALDASNRLTGFDDDSGTGRSARIEGQAGTSQIVVSSWRDKSGPTVLYANDIFQDNDRDGLGYGLERELGTCDMKNAQPTCAGVFNPQDTDRDGIEDGVEVLGVRDGALFFPRWGANPRHKDLFIEADWLDEFASTPLNQERIRSMQYTLANGPAAHLNNLDGRDGVAMHVDAGIDPTDPADRTLYGAWGGATQVPLTAFQASNGGPPAGSFDPRRLPYFRQLILLRAGGSTPFGRFWYASGESPETIMHEFGHSLGLQHESLAGGVNCSPTYPSIMSYAPKPIAAFSTGEGFPPEGRNPSSLCEADGLGPGIRDPSFISTILSIAADSRGIDWNRDGTISGTAPAGSASHCRPGERVRAVINWCPAGGDAHIKGDVKGGTVLSPATAPVGRPDGGDLIGGPALTRVGTRLYVFYIKRDALGIQRLFYQSASIGPKSTAGCTDGFKVYPNANGRADPCMHFAGPFGITLSGQIVPSRVAIFSYGERLQVVVADVSGRIRAFTIAAANLEVRAPWQNAFLEPALRDSAGSDLISGSDLSFTVIGVDRVKYGGTGRHLALYYVDRTGVVRWASKEYGAAGPLVDRGAVLNASGVPLITAPGDSPAIATWTALGNLDDLELYMGLQSQDARFRLFRYDRTRDRWGDVTQQVFNQDSIEGPGHNQKIAFWFQPILNGDGEIIERGKGFFSILFRWGVGTAGVPMPSNTNMWRSDNVSRALPPGQNLRFEVRQNFGHAWYNVRGNNYPLGLGGGFAFYSDETMPGLKGVLWKEMSDDFDQNKPHWYDLLFLPFADGIFDMDFKPMSDFKVMEVTLCRAMRGEAFCGTPAQSKWGY